MIRVLYIFYVVFQKEEGRCQVAARFTDSRQYNQKLSERMAGINLIYDIEARYQHFRETLTESTQQVLPQVERTTRQKWMTSPILRKI